MESDGHRALRPCALLANIRRGGMDVQIGDEVVVMSATGRFRIIAIDGPVVTIENANGVRKFVLQTSVRTVDQPKG